MSEDPRWINRSYPKDGMTERARRVAFTGESPNEEWVGEIEVMSGKGGTVSVHIERSHKAKYGGKKWHSVSVYATLTAEAWAHLTSAPIPVPEERPRPPGDAPSASKGGVSP
jgi:hypothetical protein